MATAGGPKIVKDGLVFGYDTNYGVADNTTATRFYPGEPATNNTIKSGYTWWGDGGNQSFANKGATTITDNSLKYNGYDTVLWTPGGSLNCYLNGAADITASDVSTVWTFSCYVKREDGAAITSLNVYMYYPSSDGAAAGTIVDCGNGWYRVSRTRTGASNYISLAGFTGFSSGKKYYLSGVMLSKTSHTVPYVAVQSSRSSTASLIDLKETTDIDVSNLSFDSTGQPTFDGSDDRITIPAGSYETIGTNNFTIEAVCKNTKTSSYNHFFSVKDQYHFAFKASNTGTGILYAYRSSSLSTTSTVSSYIPSRSEYYHIVCKREGDNLEIFVNGVSKGTKSGWNNISIDNNSWPSYIGWGNGSEYTGGDIPIVKVYNKALTATEVKQNYNAYKNRFDI